MKTYRNSINTIAVITVGIAASFCHSTAQADLITFAYEGTIDQTTGGAAFDAFLGETIRIEYTFESTTADNESDPSIGVYQDPLGTTTLTVGSNIYSSGVDVIVGNNLVAGSATFDFYDIAPAGPVSGPLVGGATEVSFIFLNNDLSHTAFADDTLPLIQPDPASFDTNTLELVFRSDGDDIGRFSASSVSIASVPEPSSFAIFSLLSLGLGVMRRRRLRTQGNRTLSR